MVGECNKQRWLASKLGGGFKCFLFSALFREDSHFQQYFWNGLKPPTSKRFEQNCPSGRYCQWLTWTFVELLSCFGSSLLMPCKHTRALSLSLLTLRVHALKMFQRFGTRYQQHFIWVDIKLTVFYNSDLLKMMTAWWKIRPWGSFV